MLPLLFAAAALSAVSLPDLPAVNHEGKTARLAHAGRPLAVQFIFTDCPTSCPLLGALFSSVQKRFAGWKDSEGPLLITVSVNPARDTAARLADWRRKFGASPRWIALRLDAKDLATLQAALGENGGPPSAHTTDIFLFDSAGNLTERMRDLPSADRVAEALKKLR